MFRLVKNAPPITSDFASKAAQGIPCPDNDSDCAWASCSLFKKASSLRKYPRLRAEYPYLAQLSIPTGKGMFRVGESKRGHIDFWRYADVCLSEFVVSVEGPSNAG